MNQQSSQPLSGMPDRQGFPHFMLKEIHDQPEVLRTCLSAYADSEQLLPAGLRTALEQVHVLACGSSLHAALVGQALLEQWVGLPTRVRSASEFQGMPLPLTPHTLTLGVSQSGATADTLGALELEQTRRSGQPLACQAKIVTITNQADSPMARQANHAIVTPAGREIGIAATKTFTSQLMVFYQLALELAHDRGMLALDRQTQLRSALHQVPEQVAMLLTNLETPIRDLADRLSTATSLVLLGRGVNYPIALEGALKLKETCYLHAEGYAAGEFLHGPIALVDAGVPVIALAPGGSGDGKILSIAEKARQYGSPLIGIAPPDPHLADLFDDLLPLPVGDEWLSPFPTVVALQLLAYEIANRRGLDVDRPRHLTKAIV